MFFAGVIVFLGYSAGKSTAVAIALGILFGLPALIIAFGKINGRPLYHTLPLVVKFFTSPKEFVFKKESTLNQRVKSVKNLEEIKIVKLENSGAKKDKLKELQLQLEQSIQDKEKLLNKNERF